MQTMLCLNQNERPKITTVQAKVEDFLYHTDACIQLHCGMKRRDSDENVEEDGSSVLEEVEMADDTMHD